MHTPIASYKKEKEKSKLSNFYYKAIVRMYEIFSVIMGDKVKL
ncbi:phosphoesterase [Bacillus cereus]|uniref:Phosphoesterase n=1 Tax=Bacillus cereus TaxID=1396 RepID=A0A2B9PLD7_BACCE|nr:phosphoesterase [Bacillus cereus]